MIINIRGTHGSGKSTIVRRVMAAYCDCKPQHIHGRRRPVGYVCSNGDRAVWVIGHYETECGGCDTLKSVEIAYEYIRTAAASGYHVIFEGLLVGHDVRRCVELRTEYGHDVMVLLLTTPIEECIAVARARRAARGDTRHLNDDNFEKREYSKNLFERMESGGVTVHLVDREDAAAKCAEAFGLPVPLQPAVGQACGQLQLRRPAEETLHLFGEA